MKIVGVVVVLTLVAGCIESADDAYTVKVRIENAALVAAQDGDGAWQQLVPDASGVARFDVTTGRFGLASLCDSATLDHAVVSYEAAKPDGDLAASCLQTVAMSEQLRGSSVPGAEIWVGYFPATADDSGRYTTWADAGTHDVLALLRGAPSRLLIARGVDLTTDRALDLPVDTEGAAMGTMTPTIVGASGPVTIYSDLSTIDDEYISFGEDPTTALVPPASLLVQGDRPSIGATSMNCTAQAALRAEPPTLVMPAPFSAAVDRTAIRWQADPSIDWGHVTATMSLWTNGGTDIQVMISASPEWLAATGTGTVLPVLDLSTLPGWRPGMAELTAGQQMRWSVDVSRGDHAGDYNACGTTGSLTW